MNERITLEVGLKDRAEFEDVRDFRRAIAAALADRIVEQLGIEVRVTYGPPGNDGPKRGEVIMETNPDAPETPDSTEADQPTTTQPVDLPDQNDKQG